MILRSIVIPFALTAASAQLVAAQTPQQSIAQSCVPAAISSLKVTLRAQKTEQWCWAASAEMLMEYFGKSVQQCDQANARLGRTDCCKAKTPKACIAGGWPELPRYGFDFKRTSGTALAWTDVQAQLAPRDPNNPCSFTPFAFSWHWVGGSGHMMVAVGYKTTSDGKRYVLVNNPWPPSKGKTEYVLYDAYVDLSGDHTHWDDFYDVKPLGQRP